MALGTVAGVQLVAVFQSLLAGFKFQVALPARLVWMLSIRIKASRIPAMNADRNVFIIEPSDQTAASLDKADADPPYGKGREYPLGLPVLQIELPRQTGVKPFYKSPA